MRRSSTRKIDFRRIAEVEPGAIIELMNHPLVRRYMPLARDRFGMAELEAFVAAKESLWRKHGYGPWAFFVDGQFVGWGGLQPEQGEADLGMVLHPDHWGIGKVLCDEILSRAFGSMGFDTVTALLPPERKRVGALLRMGFRRDGELVIEGRQFIRYRLDRPSTGAAR